jgi:hypothetical protein
MRKLTQENARLTQQLKQQEQQRIAPQKWRRGSVVELEMQEILQLVGKERNPMLKPTVQ